MLSVETFKFEGAVIFQILAKMDIENAINGTYFDSYEDLEVIRI